ncbi:MAG: aspartate carbamoyltransferase regulatory subunit [Bacteroidales bacterium]
MKDEKQLIVSAIKNGTVIDHIPAHNLFKVVDILNLNTCQTQLTIGTNLDSKHLGKKAIIKIANRLFEEQEINRIALVAPQAKFNIIENYKVIAKHTVAIPLQITSIAKCMNPQCVTNSETVTTQFMVITKGEEIELQCHYCEKVTDQENLIIIRQ